MCTAITWENGDFYFGRNMYIEYSFGEQVVIVPRKFPISYKCYESETKHYAMMGMASVMEGEPLFAEAINEKGLCMAGLNFPSFAQYGEEKVEELYNITPYEFIPWILGNCASIKETRMFLEKLNLIGIPFREKIPLAPLHWILADKKECIVVEPMAEGIKIFENPVGVLTNNPTFDFHMTNLRNYLHLDSRQPTNKLASDLSLQPLGQGAGSIGLPGDTSPTSRFIRTVFMKAHSFCEPLEASNLAQFFHILDSVAMVRGTVMTPSGLPDITSYACCINVDQKKYYYKTYENNQISVVDMEKEDLETETLKIFPLVKKQNIYCVN